MNVFIASEMQTTNDTHCTVYLTICTQKTHALMKLFRCDERTKKSHSRKIFTVQFPCEKLTNGAATENNSVSIYSNKNVEHFKSTAYDELAFKRRTFGFSLHHIEENVRILRTQAHATRLLLAAAVEMHSPWEENKKELYANRVLCVSIRQP